MWCILLRRSPRARRRAIDNALRQRRIERAAGTLNHQDQRITRRAVVTLVRLVQNAVLRVRRTRSDQRTASGGKTGRTAFRISASAFELNSSECQNAASSATIPT
jgi:hypothetical protein